MVVVDKSEQRDLVQGQKISKVTRKGIVKTEDTSVPVEHIVNVFVNGEQVMVLTCTPSDVIPLAIGRLFTEGFINGLDDVESVDLCQFSEKVTVTLNDKHAPIRPCASIEVPSCCTGNQTIASVGKRQRRLESVNSVDIDPALVFKMADAFSIDTPIHKKTYAVHSCTLFNHDGRALYSFEDLGRHNALDKAVGSALIDGVDMTKLAAYTSGRVPVDMISKIIRAHIPLFVSKASPTTSSIAVAQRYGLALVGDARPDSFNVFSGRLATFSALVLETAC